MDIYDIARLAGVSRKTVQRVLNDAPNVRPSTREKILRIMEEHHYEPNAAARQLAKRKANTIGLFIVQDERHYRLYPDDIYYGVVVGTIISACSKRGFHTLVSILDISNIDPMMSLYRQKSIDGGILISWSDVHDIVEHVTNAGFLLGVFDQNNLPKGCTDLPVPYLDNRKGGYDAGKFLIEAGHRELGIVTGHPGNPSSHERLQGFLEAAEEYGIEVPKSAIYEGGFIEESGGEAIRHWISAKRLPKAIFCSNDLTAYGALKELHKSGIRVPEEVSLIGFDDLSRSEYCHPPLTTMRVPRIDMAYYLTETLLNRIAAKENGEPEVDGNEEQIFETTLVVRESCNLRKV